MVNFRLLTTVALTALILFSGYHLISHYVDASANNKELKSSQAIYQTGSMAEVESPIEKEPIAPVILPKLQEVLSEAPELVGWINVPNTGINHPVVQHSDNDYYLEHSPNGSETKFGSIYMDFRNSEDSSDWNTAIYGHNMEDGTMFSDLERYRKRDFFYNNPYFYYDSLYGEYFCQIFSVYYSAAYSESNTVFFHSDQRFYEFGSLVADMSLYPSNISIESGDRILTLATCTDQFNNARLVIHARMMPINEIKTQ